MNKKELIRKHKGKGFDIVWNGEKYYLRTIKEITATEALAVINQDNMVEGIKANHRAQRDKREAIRQHHRDEYKVGVL